jgi:predicted transcriptional regulator
MKIGEVLNHWRRMTGRPLRDVAKEIGINTSVLHAVEGGAACDSETLVTILCWMLDRIPRKRKATAQKEGQ